MTQAFRVFDCGCCGEFHRVGYEGDCRNDRERFTADILDLRYGVDGWTIQPDESEDESESRAFERTEDSRIANHIDGYDRDDLGESPDY